MTAQKHLLFPGPSVHLDCGGADRPTEGLGGGNREGRATKRKKNGHPRVQVGENRDAWTVAPRPVTPDTARMLGFLGKVMGLCIRKGDILPVTLSQVQTETLRAV